MTILFANNAGSQLAQGINNTDDPVVFNVLDGSSFPAPGANDSFMITLQGSSGAIEIMECTSRTGNQLTATRAREGTTALPFSVGDAVDARNTAGIMGNFVQENSAIDMGGKPLSNANLTNTCQFIGGYMATQAYYDQAGTPETAIVYGTPGVAPTINGSPILTQDSAGASPTLDSFYRTVYPVGIVIFFGTDVDPNTDPNIPTGVQWTKLSDSGDLNRENAYLRMTRVTGQTGSSLAKSQRNQNATQTVGDGTGDHTHAEVGGGVRLTKNQIPGHDHRTERTGTEANFVLPNPTTTSFEPTPGGLGFRAAVNYRTGYAGGENLNQNNEDVAALHSHQLSNAGAHVHTIDAPLPVAMLVVPWQRTA